MPEEEELEIVSITREGLMVYIRRGLTFLDRESLLQLSKFEAELIEKRRLRH